MRIYYYLGRLYIIQITAIGAIWLMTYYPPGEKILWLVYMWFWIQECKYAASHLNRKQLGLLALLWQLPPYLFLFLMIPWWAEQIAYSHYSIFLIHLWHTPFLPVFAYATWIMPGGKPLYYYLYLVITPLLSLAYGILAVRFKQSVSGSGVQPEGE